MNNSEKKLEVECPIKFYERLYDSCCQMHQKYFKDKLIELKKIEMGKRKNEKD